MAKSKSIVDLFSAAYARWMSTGLPSRLNDALLKAVLRARGYQDWSGSGERWFCAKVLPQVNPHVVLDVGAHRGDYALEVLKNTQAEVHCFEPQPQLCRQMQHNLAEFGDRVRLIPKGVAARSGKLNLYCNPESPELASFSAEVNAIPYVDNSSTIEVEITTLDQYVLEAGLTRVDFIKIDTEGYELEVLQGAERLLREFKPAMIQLEFNLHHLLCGTSLYAIASLLPDYDMHQLLPGGWARRDPMDPFANVYRQANFVFLRRGTSIS